MQMSEDLKLLIILLSLWPLLDECWQTILWGLRGPSPCISAVAATALLMVGLLPMNLLISFLSQYQGVSFLLVAFLTFLLSIYGSVYLTTQRRGNPRRPQSERGKSA